VNVKAPEGSYITGPGQLALIPGAGEAIRALNRARIPVVVLTNQRGVALGWMTERDLAAVHARLRTLLSAHGASVGRIFHCPHEYGECDCRKPGTAMLERAREHLGLASLHDSVMIGDSMSDVQAGLAVGARTVLLGAGSRSLPAGVEVAASLLDAVRRALGSDAEPHP